MKKVKMVKIVSILVSLIALWGYRYINFNKEIAAIYTPKRISYDLGEVVEYGDNLINLNSYKGCSIKLLDAKIYTPDEFFSLYNVGEENVLTNSKLCILELEFINGSNYNKKLSIGDFMFQSPGKNFYPSIYTIDINPELSEEQTSFYIAPRNKTQFCMVYVIEKEFFSHLEQNKLREYPMLFFVTEFPEERVIQMTLNLDFT